MAMRCRYCGEECVIRFYNGIKRPFGCRCSGGNSYPVERTPPPTAKRLANPPKPSLQIFDKRDEDFTRKTTCKECGERIWFVRYNGGSVLFDELGWPWPRHRHCWPSQSTKKALMNLEQRYNKRIKAWKIGVVSRLRRLDDEDHYLVAIRWAAETQSQTVWKLFGLGKLKVGELVQAQDESIGAKVFLGNAHSFVIIEKELDPRILELPSAWSSELLTCAKCDRRLSMRVFFEHCYNEHCTTLVFDDFYEVVTGKSFNGFKGLADDAKQNLDKLRGIHDSLILKPPTPSLDKPLDWKW
jgi:hypothetical protein